MKFCGQCGQQLIPEARFCVSCGAAVLKVPTTASSAAGAADAAVPDHQRQPEYAAAAGGSVSGQGTAIGERSISGEGSAASQDYSPAQPSAANTAGDRKPASAFTGIPLSDYVRDGAAALALIMSLFMAWSYGSDGTSKAATRVDVVLITLVSLLSLGLSYVWRAGVFGPATGYRRIQDLKLLANAPYVLMVLVYTALSLISADRFDPGAVAALGPAVAFGLAGALLAAQPRRAEIAPGAVDESRNRRWIHVTLGVAALASVVALVQIIRYWAAYSGSGSSGWGIVATLMALASPAVLLIIAVRVHQRSDGWRRAGVALALGSGFLSLLALFEDLTLLQLSVTAFVPGFSLLFWMAFGAAVSAPSVARLTEASQVASTDTRNTLQPLLFLAAGLSAVLALGSAVTVITVAVDGYSGGLVPQMIALFFGLLLTAGAILTLRLTGKDPRSAYIMPSGYAGLLVVLGLVLLIVWVVQDEDFYLGPVIMLLTFVVPAALLAALWLPAASREQFRRLPAAAGSETSGFSFAGAPAQAPAEPQRPVTEAAAGSPADRGDRASEETAPVDRGTNPAHSAPAAAAVVVDPDVLTEAANPGTPLARLQELAANHPLARPAVAANPSTYPALLAWLSELGDPAVDQALRQRG
ncbi:zinc ribbon domain-containing protein [Arthrobacter sp. 9E18]|uniref:zinc ribbon domain-containing protein n=1 Tax=unclassified Arthrobacter TaxID=235627 RepID=UPI0034D65DC1